MKIIFAPIMGVTDHVYRQAFAQFFSGVDLAMAPFLSSVQARSIKPAYLKDLLPENNQSLPVVPQILSKDPDDFLFLAHKIVDLGYSTVNWNLGCPSPTVINKRRGSGLLPFPGLIGQFLDRVLADFRGKLSIKLRLGRYAAEEIEALWPIFNQYPLAEIIVHPRLGRQLYYGSVDLDAFGCCLTHSKHRLVYNGDIRTVQDFRDLSARFPTIDSWMIGRGLLMNPFLATEIRSFHNPSLKSGKEMAILRAFHAELYEKYKGVMCGPSHLLSRMKGFWSYFAENFCNPDKVRKKIHKCNTPDQYLTVVRSLFDSDGFDSSPSRKTPVSG
ncbi:MAG: tRNA-dihydrouridine synthase family protein [Desulfobulbaceae bacterium]|nr:tRNA-dihydrouridine synthase family protein [Desulfobulbaceae bacterium]